MSKTRIPLIYMVDDDDHHLDLVKRIFNRFHADCHLRCFSDGSDLLIHLTHELDGKLPNLILLDWGMPILSGKRVLEMLQIDESWRHIPVVVLSASDVDEDRAQSYNLGSRAFIAKAETLDDLISTIALIRELWID